MTRLADELESVARSRVRVNSGGPASDLRRRILNFISGVGVTVTVADDATNEKADITFTAVVGTPKVPSSFTLPTNYFLDQMFRLTLTGTNRATLQGNADLILNDDFKTRSRIVLS